MRIIFAPSLTFFFFLLPRCDERGSLGSEDDSSNEDDENEQKENYIDSANMDVVEEEKLPASIIAVTGKDGQN